MLTTEELPDKKNNSRSFLISRKIIDRVKAKNPHCDKHPIITRFQFIIINSTVTRGAQADVTRQSIWMAEALKMFWPSPGMTAPAADLTAESRCFSNPAGVSELRPSPSGRVGTRYKGAE